ncbi:MAG: T9SS type A sorting domain-containing protein [Bacteroidota bacterium]
MKYSLIILLIFFWLEGDAQTNLVPNPSFEFALDCTGAEITRAAPWFTPANTCDYFNSCFYSPFYFPCGGGSVPNNNFGFQEARTGQAYAGIGLCELGDPLGGYREYIEVKLLDTLKRGRIYCVEFWVSLARICQSPLPIGIDAIGTYFSNDTLKYSSNDTSLVFNVAAQIQNPEWNIITDTTNWVKVSGWFVAQGGESYMTIGNFKRDENTHTLVAYTNTPGSNGDIAYYYIDDVSVIRCDSISPFSEGGIVIYPNPTEDEFNIEVKGNTAEISFEIFNSTGQWVYKGSMIEKALIPTHGFAAGMYVVRLNVGGHWVYKKLLKN